MHLLKLKMSGSRVRRGRRSFSVPDKLRQIDCQNTLVFVLCLLLCMPGSLQANTPLELQPAAQPEQTLKETEKGTQQNAGNPADDQHVEFFSLQTLASSNTLSPREVLKLISVSIDRGADYTNTRDVTLSSQLPPQAAGFQMRYAVNSFSESRFLPWEDAASTKTIRLPGADGRHYINVCFRDGQGNSGCKWDSILLDRTKPAGSFKIHGGAQFTKSLAVTLAFNQVTDTGSGAVEFRYAVNSREENKFSAWQTLGTKKNITLPAFEGRNFVNVCFRDRAGNTGCAWQAITLDRSRPAVQFTLNGGSEKTNNRNILLSLSGSDAGSGIESFRYSFNSLKEESFTAWENYAAEKQIRLPGFAGKNFVNVCYRDRAGNTGCSWKAIQFDPAYIPVSQRVMKAGMAYFENSFGTVEPTHQYPGEGLDYMEYTQPSNLGFYAELLATVASGGIQEGPISKQTALARLNILVDHLLEDQTALGYKGLLPWLKFKDGDWSRREADILGRQVSFEDNTNLTLMLAAAYGALRDKSLAGNALVHGTPAAAGLLEKIDSFIDYQKEGYACLYDSAKGQFRRSMAINEAVTTCGAGGSPAPVFSGGNVDFFGAESRSPVLFLALRFGDVIPPQVYTNLIVSQARYEFADGTTARIPAPFQGSFQMLWPALLMPENLSPELKAMQERYVDILLDYSKRNNVPGFLSASYNIMPVGSILNASDKVVGFGEAKGERTSEGWHVGAPVHTWSGTAFVQHNLDLQGNALVLKYKSASPVSESWLEIKKERNGFIEVLHTVPITLKNTAGAEETLRIDLSGISAPLTDIDELVLITKGGTPQVPLDLTFTRFDIEKPAFRSFYDASAGITEIAFSGECCTAQAASLYTLGIARMFRPEAVDALLEDILAKYPALITEHGLWEGVNMEYNRVITEQIFPNVATFLLGVAGKTPGHMLRYLEEKNLDVKLNKIWRPEQAVDVLAESDKSAFLFLNKPGVSYKLRGGRILSGRTIEISHNSTQEIKQVRLELKHRGAHEAVTSFIFDLKPGEKTLRFELPRETLLWNIHEFVLLLPEGAQAEGLLSNFRVNAQS